MLKSLKITLNFLFFLILASSIQAANSLDVIINEIAWMGTESSYNDEWIELYNNTDSSINLNGWSLKAVDKTPEINLTGTISGKGFYLLERTNDTTVPNILANQIYTGASSNKGEYLKLFNSQNNLIDEVNCGDGWFAGDNVTKATMERKNSQITGSDSDNWATSLNPNGTPKAENSVSIAIGLPSPEESPTQPEPQSEPKPELTPQEESQPITYPSGILINEVIPSPEGPDNLEEWIELKNINNEEVSLYKWKIQDTIGSVTTYTFSEGTKIRPKGFLVLSRPTTKITLNNSGDGLNLIQPDGNILNTMNYEKAPRAQSYNLTETGWFWSTVLTPGATNIISVSSQLEQVKEISFQKEVEESLSKKELAAIGEQTSMATKPLSVFLIALFLSTFSGIIILALKRKKN